MKTDDNKGHIMGNMTPRGMGDRNREPKGGAQIVNKVFQEYRGSQTNPRMDEDETMPFNIGKKEHY